jgi:hypothetical protein
MTTRQIILSGGCAMHKQRISAKGQYASSLKVTLIAAEMCFIQRTPRYTLSNITRNEIIRELQIP